MLSTSKLCLCVSALFVASCRCLPMHQAPGRGRQWVPKGQGSTLWRGPAYSGVLLPYPGLHPEVVLPVRTIPPCSVAPGMRGGYVGQVELPGRVFADRHDVIGLPGIRGRRRRQGIINRLPAYVAHPPGLPIPFPCLFPYSLPTRGPPHVTTPSCFLTSTGPPLWTTLPLRKEMRYGKRPTKKTGAPFHRSFSHYTIALGAYDIL